MSKTILIIDDDSTMRDSLGAYFKGKGYTVSEASSGKTGVALIKEEKPDAVLLDIMMPEMNGIDVIKEVAAGTPEMLSHITLMTNSSNMKFLSDAVDLGVFKYILKAEMSLEHVFKIVEGNLGK